MKQMRFLLMLISLFNVAFACAQHENSYQYNEELENFKKSPQYDLIFNEEVHPMVRAFNCDIENYKQLSYWERVLRFEILAIDTVVVTPETMPKLYAYVDAMCKEAGIKTPTIFVTAGEGFLNAMAMKLLNSTGAIVIGQKLLKKTSDLELEAILAHEVGHIKYNHTNKTVCLMLANFGVVQALKYYFTNEFTGSPFTINGIIKANLACIAAGILTNLMINKKFEKQADIFAYKEMNKAKGLSAFLKYLVEKENKYNADLDATYANLQANESKMTPENFEALKWNYSVNKWIVAAVKWVYHDTPFGPHPSPEARIERIQAYLDEYATAKEDAIG